MYANAIPLEEASAASAEARAGASGDASVASDAGVSSSLATLPGGSPGPGASAARTGEPGGASERDAIAPGGVEPTRAGDSAGPRGADHDETRRAGGFQKPRTDGCPFTAHAGLERTTVASEVSCGSFLPFLVVQQTVRDDKFWSLPAPSLSSTPPPSVPGRARTASRTPPRARLRSPRAISPWSPGA